MHTDYAILIVLGVLLMLSPVTKGLMERIGMPPLVGFIGLGFIVSLANQQWFFFSEAFMSVFAVLAQLGVVALLFRVGLRSHTQALLAKLPDASLLWLGDVLLSLGLIFAACYYVLDLSLVTALVITTALSATSVAVSVAVWDEAGRMDTSTGQLLLDVAELDDLSGVVLLAVLLAVIPGMLHLDNSVMPSLTETGGLVLLKLLLFFTGCYLFSHYLEPGFTRFNRSWGNSTALTITVLGAGLAIAAVAGMLGFSMAIGALFAGLAFSRDPEAVRTDAKFSYFYEFLTPFFFIYIGMQVDPALVAPALGLVPVLLMPAIFGKFFGVALPALAMLKRRDAVLLGVSMVPRAEITMVIVFQCRQFGPDVVSDEIFAAMVVIAVLTSLLAPPVLRKLLTSERAIA